MRTVVRKLQGSRAKPKQPDVPDDPSAPEDEGRTSSSASQMSFDNRIGNFDKLIQLLAAHPGYAPNEADLAVAGLTALHTSMVAANTAVVDAYTVLSNARIARDKQLYRPGTGMVDATLNAKSYIKSLFGASSPEYNQVNGLRFTRPRYAHLPESGSVCHPSPSERAQCPSDLAECSYGFAEGILDPAERFNGRVECLGVLAKGLIELPKGLSEPLKGPNVLAEGMAQRAEATSVPAKRFAQQAKR